MDKCPKEEKRFTLKINGKKKSTDDHLVIHNWQTKKETAVTKQGDFLQSYKTIKKKPKKNKRLKTRFPSFYSNKQQMSLMKVSIIVLSAVVIGLSIGFFLLKVIDKDGTRGGHLEKDAPAFNGNVGSEQLVLPGKDLLFLQQGAYQNEDSVKQLLNQYKQHQLPAAYIHDGDYYRVFVALINDEESAKKLMESSFFRDHYGETWPKKVETKERIFRNLTGDEKKFLEVAYSIFNQLVEEGTKALLQGEKYVGNFEAIDREIENIRSLTNIEQKSIQQLHQSLLNGYEQLQRFSKTRKVEEWQKGQAELLQFAVDFYFL
ncbi:SPOR domain-containing protein [Fervidibacillus halotolerans]|uniref:SPOR domain-containing protein n=1 Tax=Fervidibacillus halotolerans TaxID=2980027 RepID=A0A9E8LXL2_9BACI|nr:SPOR domain-containing protein [Fervidibacillus halotolerans]WAA11588.1 SPOR domain-containing protein [Fervidibacillus halotolerans]